MNWSKAHLDSLSYFSFSCFSPDFLRIRSISEWKVSLRNWTKKCRVFPWKFGTIPSFSFRIWSARLVLFNVLPPKNIDSASVFCSHLSWSFLWKRWDPVFVSSRSEQPPENSVSVSRFSRFLSDSYQNSACKVSFLEKTQIWLWTAGMSAVGFAGCCIPALRRNLRFGATILIARSSHQNENSSGERWVQNAC